VLGTGGFGITYLADEEALGRRVTIKEYFPAEFAARRKQGAAPRSYDVTEEYQWGLDRFIEEAQTLARFDHPNIVRVHRYFRANNTAYMVLHFEEGGSFRAWLKGLKRPPTQAELDRMIAPLLDALEIIHDADFLHRDIAPDNIMVRKDGSPVLIDFGSARGAVTARSRTVSALVKPGYSPYEQYATTGANQGPWTDIYALGATLYHAIGGKRPPDAPSRVVRDEYVPARVAAQGTYRDSFLAAIDKALRTEIRERPQSIAAWREALLDGKVAKPSPARKSERLTQRLPATAPPSPRRRKTQPAPPEQKAPAVEVAAPQSVTVPASLVPAPPDAPQPRGQLLDFIEALKRRRPGAAKSRPSAPASTPTRKAKFAPAPPEPAKLPPPPDVPPVPAPAASASLSREPEPSLSAPRRLLFGRRAGWSVRVRRWSTGLFRVAVAVGVTSLAVAYQQSLRSTSGSPDAASPTDVAAPGVPLQLTGHRGAVIAVASADEDGWIVSAGADATLRLWSGASGAPVRTIELSEGAVTAFAAEARRALVGHRDGTVVLWDLEHGQRLETVHHGEGAITSVAFVGEGFIAARQDGSVAVFQVGAATAPAAQVDGQDGGGPLVAAADRHSLFVSGGLDRTVRLWHTPGPRLKRTYRRSADNITAIDIAPDGGVVAGGSGDGTVHVWPNPVLRSLRPAPVQSFKAHDGRVTAIAVGPSGMLATAGVDGSVKVGSLRPQPRVVRSLAADHVRTLSFSRDGRRLLGGAEDGTIRVWPLPPPITVGAI
jgi:serine/threonine protein kinase